MASFIEHCKDCKEQLGEEFPQVHKWLDEYFPILHFDARHRDVRHHEEGIEEVRKMWGDRAAEAARVHISKDFDGWVPKTPNEVQEWRFGIVHTPE
jgi:DNA-binding GntR family transcriptional regulator